MDCLCNSIYSNTIEPQISAKYPPIKQTDNLCSFITDIQQSDIKNKKTLVVFDIDRTIFRETNEDDGEKMFKEVPGYNYNMKLEPYSVELINNLTQSSDVICLTIRNFNYKIDLQKYDIDLCNQYNKIELTSWQQQQLLKSGYMYDNNIIYTYGKEKGNPLLMFYNLSATKYDKVYFIDDKHQHCVQVNTKLTNSNIDVTTYNIDPKLKHPDNSQIEKLNFMEQIISKQQPYFHTKCEIIVEQPVVNDLVVTDITF